MNAENYSEISKKNVRDLIKKNHMSIRQLAEKINVPPTTLNDSLKSKKGISINSLIKIADIFDVTVNDLCNASFNSNALINNQFSEEKLFVKFQQLDKHGKEIVSLIIEKEFERMNN